MAGANGRGPQRQPPVKPPSAPAPAPALSPRNFLSQLFQSPPKTPQRPQRLSQQQWLEIWHGSHTQVAIDTQSTFGYRQNVVARPVTYAAPPFDAIIEENFPAAAMSSQQAFYGVDSDQALKENWLTEATLPQLPVRPGLQGARPGRCPDLHRPPTQGLPW